MPTILVVDDYAPCRELMREYLEAKGYKVWAMGDYDNAGLCLFCEPIDAALIDVNIPNEPGDAPAPHGIELARDCAALGIPACLHTAGDLDYAKHPEAHAFTVLRKPFESLAVLTNWLDGVGVKA